jgi:hypothetical protein
VWSNFLDRIQSQALYFDIKLIQHAERREIMSNLLRVYDHFYPILPFNTGFYIQIYQNLAEKVLSNAFTINIDADVFFTPIGSYNGKLTNGLINLKVVTGQLIPGEIDDWNGCDDNDQPVPSDDTNWSQATRVECTITGIAEVTIPIPVLRLKLPIKLVHTHVSIPIHRDSTGAPTSALMVSNFETMD